MSVPLPDYMLHLTFLLSLCAVSIFDLGRLLKWKRGFMYESVQSAA